MVTTSHATSLEKTILIMYASRGRVGGLIHFQCVLHAHKKRDGGGGANEHSQLRILYLMDGSLDRPRNFQDLYPSLDVRGPQSTLVRP